MGAERKKGGAIIKIFIQNPLHISKIPLEEKVKLEFNGKIREQKQKKGGARG
jgi:hypothetical protein